MADTLTERRQRLCKNCLSAVSGIYCAQCGQKQRSAVRHFGQMVGEFLDDVLNIDTKLLNTLKPLLYRPGFLSLEYYAERRVRYVSPLKLYFFMSLFAFFLIQQSIDLGTTGPDAFQITNETDADAKAEGKPSQNFISFGDKPWNAETNPLTFSWLPDAGNSLLNARIGKFNTLLVEKRWLDLVHAALAATPQALLILVPIFALMLKVLYLYKRRLYMEHLILALHNHAFLLFAIILLVLSTGLQQWLGTGSVFSETMALFSGVLTAWIPLYFLLSLKNIYQQGWLATVFKFTVVGIIYLVLMALGIALVFFLSVLFIL